jgi:RNA polymerase sigma-70 factor (ECF subfamily)
MTEGIHDVSASEPSLIGLESWIEAARHGDREALGQALLSVRDYLLLIANEGLDPALQGKGNASDLVQETFLLAQRGVGGFRGRTASEWRVWLRSILIHSLAKERRRFGATAKRTVQREVTIPDAMKFECAADNETPSRNLAQQEREAALFEGMERLPEHYRNVVVWHHRERLSFEEIGRRSGISAEAARKLWMRALGRLRKELGPAHDWR